MTQEVVSYRVCDVCPEDTAAVVTDRVTLNGYSYEIDLCQEHSAELYGAVMRFADCGVLVREPSVLDKPKVYAPVAVERKAPVPERTVEVAAEVPLAALQWTLSAHAEERMVERGFTKTEVLLTCAEPEVVLPPARAGMLEQRKRDRCLVVVDPESFRVVTVKVAGETRHTWNRESA